ncbi:transglycosylase SLT domain-containing protein [Uliginosibacterium paludis]|uniref:Transglycosylase SLT domain-containing protein n=1 Tax=Uliginosibacterium paludis TaxID=1615952 RepID=A0ABV2CKF4_9RHOO
MTHVVRLSRFFKHLFTFIVHFAHGGFVMLGAIVMALGAYQVIQFGPAGLDPRSAFGYKPAVGAYASEDVALADESLEESAGAERVSGMPAGYARVANAIAKRHRVSPVVVETLVQAAIKEGRSNGIDPMLILAVITVESRFNPFAESAFGAQGLMQIIPRFHVEKIASEKGAAALFDPIENIRVGTMILKNYIRSTGSVDAGLQMYGGASADPEMSYAAKVQSELERLRALSHPGGPLRTANRAGADPQA